jgi:FixJ family two-component response regulator
LPTSFIALVEDDESVLEALESLLEYAGYHVLPFFSAEELLDSGRLHEVRLLITDIGLPGINGIELLRILRTRRADLPALVITARVELKQAAREAGARQVFLKPLDDSQLLEAIEAALR